MSQKEEPKTPEAAAPKSSLLSLVAIILPALLAGGASFGGVKLGAAHAATPAPSAEHAAPVPPPGPTVALEPFLVMTLDAAKKTHAMKVTLAVEFEATGKESKEEGKEDPLRGFVPRIRDTALSYLRGVSYEDAMDNSCSEKMRAELLERFKTAGVAKAARVLLTDLVVQ